MHYQFSETLSLPSLNSPYYFLKNIGNSTTFRSLKTEAIYHHLQDFINLSCIVGIVYRLFSYLVHLMELQK